MDKKSGISRFLAQTTILPLVLSGIICGIAGILFMSAAITDNAGNELEHLAKATVAGFDRLYPGDYSMYEGDSDQLYTKGDTILNLNYDYLDELKEETEADYTLFYQDVRVITTLVNSDGERIIGSKANKKIAEAVETNKTSKFYRNVELYDVRYFCYYEPIYNSDGTCIGMLAVLKPSDQLFGKVKWFALSILAIVVLAALYTYFRSRRRSVQLTAAAGKLAQSLEQIADGTLSNTVPADLLARKDEFGTLAHAVVDMQAALRVLVERDALTGLFNRRFGQKRLKQAMEKTHESGQALSIALGDIDFFKKFNDTYGHDCGDNVLSQTSATLRDSIKEYGFVSRWGGEEFLVVLNKGNFEEHKELMQSVIKKIDSNHIRYHSSDLTVSITFGLIDATKCKNTDEALTKVDKLLYKGKEEGRNRLVY
jgi:diguanylate cyclase (GGDEF)-like protein